MSLVLLQGEVQEQSLSPLLESETMVHFPVGWKHVVAPAHSIEFFLTSSSGTLSF